MSCMSCMTDDGLVTGHVCIDDQSICRRAKWKASIRGKERQSVLAIIACAGSSRAVGYGCAWEAVLDGLIDA